MNRQPKRQDKRQAPDRPHKRAAGVRHEPDPPERIGGCADCPQQEVQL